MIVQYKKSLYSKQKFKSKIQFRGGGGSPWIHHCEINLCERKGLSQSYLRMPILFTSKLFIPLYCNLVIDYDKTRSMGPSSKLVRDTAGNIVKLSQTNLT